MTGACFMFIIMSDFAKTRELGDICTKRSQNFAEKQKPGDSCTKRSQNFAKKREAGDFCTIPQEGLCILEENRSRS